MNCTTNRMEVYSICRERISLANALSLASKVMAPERPRTREQRRLQRMERWNKWVSEAQDTSSQESERPSFRKFLEGPDITN